MRTQLSRLVRSAGICFEVGDRDIDGETESAARTFAEFASRNPSVLGLAPGIRVTSEAAAGYVIEARMVGDDVEVTLSRGPFMRRWSRRLAGSPDRPTGSVR